MLALFVIVPLVAAALLSLALGKKPKAIRWVALSASILSLVIAIYVAMGPQGVSRLDWFSIAGYSFGISIATNPLNAFLLLIVAGITPLIFAYSIGYLDTLSEQSRFYTEMCIFAAAMMLFAISGNFITMFIAWEMLGITSYLLIGFWYWREKAPVAARKAITTILIGDIMMLMGMLLIWSTYHTFEFAALATVADSQALQVAMILITLAAFTKSAQFPFHEWLADAMEGPTPVSAFLHSSTMVKAGVFLIAVLLPVIVAVHLQWLLIIVGIVTALIGATNAIAERHIKRILAYSTMEDMGLMFVALGFNAIYAAMLLFLVQAFYKALLFMDAGSIMRINTDKEDIYNVYESGARKGVLISALIGSASLAGIFPLSGFFGKAAVESVASNAVIYALLLLVEILSSFYIFRWLIIPSRKAPLEEDREIVVNAKTMSKWMAAPAYILAIAVVASSLAYLYLPRYLLGLTYPVISITGSIVDTVVVLMGALAAYYVYAKGNRSYLSSTHPTFHKIMLNSMAVNAVYVYITKAVSLAASAVGSIDYAFDKSIYALSSMFVKIGDVLKKMETGQTNTYVAAFIIGFVILLLAVVL